MQRVAATVGVRAPSLHKRVRSRDDLVRLIGRTSHTIYRGADAVIGSDDPQRDLRALADTMRTFAHAQPTTYALLFARLPESAQPDPDRLALAGRAVPRTAAALCGPDRTLEAARTVVAWAHGFISMEFAGAFRMG
jgi:AcrR family transcriptional regulator